MLTGQNRWVVRLAGWVISTMLSCVCAQTPSAVVSPEWPVPKPVDLHPWQAALPRLSPEAYLVNVHDGDKIETPFLLRFGLSGGWGLAPISKPIGGKSGHHHLLINQNLPTALNEGLPFSDKYIHFGKGQMEMVFNALPGTYTLRLLMADPKHLPHFIYSKQVSVVVTKKNDIDPKSLIKPGISMNLAGDEVAAPFRVQFHASGLNVAHLSQQEKDTGHFRLTVSPKNGGKPAEIDLVNGQTEVWLAPPAGDYRLKLAFLNNLNPTQSLVPDVFRDVKVN